MSEYVVHFTKEAPPRSAYDVMTSILYGCRLIPGGRYGIASGLHVAPAQEAVCFSEIPLDRLDRLIERRSKWGVGFRQEVLFAAGGGRVWYVDKGTALARSVEALMREDTTGHGFAPTDDPIWKLTPFIDLPGEYGHSQYRFEWEREWRVPGEMRFSPEQVAFLFIPEEWHGAARGFYDMARAENIGPAFDCPFLDPLWPQDRLQAALATVR